MSFFGLFIQNKMTYNREYSAQEKVELLNFCGYLQSGSHTVLNWGDMARDIKKVSPVSEVFLRLSEFDKPFYFSENLLSWGASKTLDGLLKLSILNEPNGYDNEQVPLDRLADICVRVLRWYGERGIGVKVCGFGEGHPDITRSSLNKLLPLFQIIAEYPKLHRLDVHEYGTHRGMIYVANPNAPREEQRWNTYPWRVGRTETFIIPYLKEHKLNLQINVGEYGIDSAHDGNPKRFWQDSFNESEYLAELVEPVDPIYSKEHYLGVNVFTYGNTGHSGSSEDWKRSEVNGFEKLQQGMISYNQYFYGKYRREPEKTPPTLPTIPPVTEEDAQPGEGEGRVFVPVVSQNGKHKVGVYVEDNGDVILRR